MKTLITGGSGFIGLHMANYLSAQGHDIDLVDDFSRGVDDFELAKLRAKKGVQVIKLDLLNRAGYDELGNNYDYVYHFAAIIGVANVLSRPYSVLTKNVQMLEAILEFTSGLPHLKRFLFPSTSEVYAGTLQYFDLPIPTPESVPLGLTALEHPRTSYMLSKIYGEALCHQVGIPFTIIRPHNIFGPRMGMAHVIPELLKKAYMAPVDGVLEVASVGHSRTFCYIDDAVRQIQLAVELDAGIGKTLNVGTQAQEITMGELAQIIVDIVCTAEGKKINIVKAATTLGSVSRRCPDMTLTTKTTGYESSINLVTGINRTFEWYRKNIF